jgi:hypothetical protein
MGWSILDADFTPNLVRIARRFTGYERRGPFGEYPNDPLSVFMQKRISALDVVAKEAHIVE